MINGVNEQLISDLKIGAERMFDAAVAGGEEANQKSGIGGAINRLAGDGLTPKLIKEAELQPQVAALIDTMTLDKNHPDPETVRRTKLFRDNPGLVGVAAAVAKEAIESTLPIPAFKTQDTDRINYQESTPQLSPEVARERLSAAFSELATNSLEESGDRFGVSRIVRYLKSS